MDLYGFISDNVPKPSPKDQGQETWAKPQYQGTSLYNEAGAQTRSVMEPEALAALKEELLNKINTLENHIATIKVDLDTLSQTKDTTISKATALIIEKSSEMERLRSDISVLQQESSETLSRIQNAERGNQRCLDEAERIKSDCSVFIKDTQRALVIACIVALLVIAGLFMYFSKRTASKQGQASQAGLTDTTKVTNNAVIVVWPRRPIALNIGDFRISLSPLESGAASKLAAETKDTTTNTHSFYNLEIRTKQGAISANFLKAPSIDFINRSGTHAKAEGSGSDLRVMHISMSGKQPLKKGTGLFSCVVSLKKEFQPGGILIGGLNKKTRLIAIYA